MLIDKFPEATSALLEPLVFLEPRVRHGQAGFSFAHPTLPLWAGAHEGQWCVRLGRASWTMPLRGAADPAGFQADLAYVFSRNALRGIQLLHDSLSWWFQDSRQDSWDLLFTGNIWRLVTKGERRTGHRIPACLAHLRDQNLHVMFPIIYEWSLTESIGLRPFTQMQGGIPTSMHARLFLQQSIQEQALALGLPDFWNDLSSNRT